MKMSENLPKVRDHVSREAGVGVPRSKIYRMKLKVKVPVIKKKGEEKKKKQVRFNERIQVFFIPARRERRVDLRKRKGESSGAVRKM